MQMSDIEARKAELTEMLTDENADLDAINSEVDELNERAAQITAEVEKRDAIISAIAEHNEGTVITEIREETTTMTNKEIRNSKEYIDAYAKYLATGKDEECRALLTENVAGVVPVPEFVYDVIKHAWEDNGLLTLVSKSYFPGNLKVGFEVSASDAVHHVEGSGKIDEEALVLGIAELKPISLKKYITISDEAIDLGGEALIRYIYEELAHKIAKLAADDIVTFIKNKPATSTQTEAAVGQLEVTALGLDTVINLIALLSDEAEDITLVMNKATWAYLKGLAIAANYPIDVFDERRVVFNNTLAAPDTATEGDCLIIAGDFRYGFKCNFPKGEEITLKYDDLSLAESDLVKIVGRMYVGMDVVAPYAFAQCLLKNE